MDPQVTTTSPGRERDTRQGVGITLVLSCPVLFCLLLLLTHTKHFHYTTTSTFPNALPGSLSTSTSYSCTLQYSLHLVSLSIIFIIIVTENHHSKLLLSYLSLQDAYHLILHLKFSQDAFPFRWQFHGDIPEDLKRYTFSLFQNNKSADQIRFRKPEVSLSLSLQEFGSSYRLHFPYISLFTISSIV